MIAPAKHALVVIFLFCSLQAISQTGGLGTWNVLTGRYTLNKRWSLFGEAQLRSQQFHNHYSYHEYKAGVGYNFKNNGAFLLAMGHYTTYQPDGNFKTPNVTEFRTWQQFVLNNNINRLKLEHRYRIEQRFLPNTYRNRFRYRLNALLPFGHRVIEKRTLYASVFNEFFVSNEAPFFEQNRMFGGLGYQFDDHITLLAGLLNRFDNISPSLQTRKNFLLINLLFSFGEAKTGRERHPSSLD